MEIENSLSFKTKPKTTSIIVYVFPILNEVFYHEYCCACFPRFETRYFTTSIVVYVHPEFKRGLSTRGNTSGFGRVFLEDP